MTRTKREIYVTALDALLKGKVAPVAMARDWELLAEIAKLAQNDAPRAMAATDPVLFRRWRTAVTNYHLAGWGNMTPERVAEVSADYELKSQSQGEVAPRL